MRMFAVCSCFIFILIVCFNDDTYVCGDILPSTKEVPKVNVLCCFFCLFQLVQLSS